MPDRAGVEVGILEWIKFMITTIPHAPNFWASRPAVVEGRLSKFILEEVRKNWGGGVLLRRCHMRSFGCDNLVHSVVICHPGRFPISQAKAMKVPAA